VSFHLFWLSWNMTRPASLTTFNMLPQDYSGDPCLKNVCVCLPPARSPLGLALCPTCPELVAGCSILSAFWLLAPDSLLLNSQSAIRNPQSEMICPPSSVLWSPSSAFCILHPGSCILAFKFAIVLRTPTLRAGSRFRNPCPPSRALRRGGRAGEIRNNLPMPYLSWATRPELVDRSCRRMLHALCLLTPARPWARRRAGFLLYALCLSLSLCAMRRRVPTALCLAISISSLRELSEISESSNLYLRLEILFSGVA